MKSDPLSIQRRRILRLPLYAFLLSFLWIIATDRLLELYVHEDEMHYLLHTGKEICVWAVVCLSMYWLLKRDQSRQHQAMQLLQDSQAQITQEREVLESIFQASPLPIVLVHPEGTVAQWNRAAEQVFGWTREEVLGVKAPIAQKDASRYAAMLARLRQGEVIRGEHTLRPTKDGSLRHIVTYAAPLVPGTSRENPPTVLLLEDITDARRLEEEREQLFAYSQDLVGIADDEGRFLQVNPAWEHTLGWTDAEVVGKRYLDFVHPDDAERTIAAIQSIVEGKVVRDFVNRYRHKDGGWRWLSWNAGALANRSRILGVARDVTEAIQAQQALEAAKDEAEQANRAKTTFLMNMSHELRTPIHGILGMAQVGMREQDLAWQHSCWEHAEREAQALLEMVNNLLEVARIETGIVEVGIAPFSLHTLVHELYEPLAQDAAEKGVQTSLHIDPSAPDMVRGDPQLLRRLLVVVLDNALQFTPFGAIQLDVRKAPPGTCGGLGPAVAFTITDTGVGIPVHKQQEIFEPFRLGEEANTKAFGGSGVGLSIAKSLVALLEGTIHVDSAPDQGSVFRICLPLVSGDTPEEAAETGRDLPKKVLLVEDEAVNRLWLSTMLRNAGLTVLEAANGRQALEVLSQEPGMDAVLMDIQMPLMDGIEATTRIRAGEVSGCDPAIPIIATTAYASPETTPELFKAGVDAVLAKPFESDAVLRALEHVIP